MPQPSLDELALQLMQVAPADIESTRLFAEAMREAADTSAGLAPTSIIAILKCTDALEHSADADREAVLGAAGTLLEQWMRGGPLSWVTPSAVTTSAAAPDSTAASDLADSTAPVLMTALAAVPEGDADAPSDQPTALPDDVDLDLLRDFITESRDMLAGAEAALLLLETEPSNDEAVNTVFRAFHTVKGTSAFLGLDRLSRFAHKAENLLSQVRDRAVPYNAQAADLSLQSADMLREFLDAVDAAAADGSAVRVPEGVRELTAMLEAAAAGSMPAAPTDEPALPAARLGDILVDRGVVDRDTVEAVHAEEPTVPLGEALL